MKYLIYVIVAASSICRLLAVDSPMAQVAYRSSEARLNSMLGNVSIPKSARAFRLGCRAESGEVVVETIIHYGDTVTFVVDNQIPFKSEVVRTSIVLSGFDMNVFDKVPDIQLLCKLDSEVKKSAPLTGGPVFYVFKKQGDQNWVYARCPITIAGKHLEPFEYVLNLFKIARDMKSQQTGK